MEIKNIVVPTDFSTRADSALAIAAEIAHKSGASISLLHIIDVPAESYASSDAISMEKNDSSDLPVAPYMAKIMSYTKERFAELKAKYSDINITEKVVFDKVSKQVAEFVTENKASLVVVGSNGASGLDEIMVGSNTEKIVRFAKCPVLVVKADGEKFLPKNIVYASDFENDVHQANDFLKLMNKYFGSKIHLVKIITPNNFETSATTHKRIESFIERNKLEGATVNYFNYYTEEEGIISFAEHIEADLITLATHGRTGVARFLMGSIAENVTNHSPVSVAVFKIGR
jgi:nucleotide-binding universal stress UspA family protein